MMKATGCKMMKGTACLLTIWPMASEPVIINTPIRERTMGTS